MLSTHDVSLQRISWGMAAVAIVTATGLALTASGSRAAQEMAAITDKVQAADFGRLKDLVAQPVQAQAAVAASSDEDYAPSAPVAPAAPSDPAVMASDWTPPAVPMAPTAPIPPAADMSVPMPPAPPAPPTVRTYKDRVVVSHANGRTETHRIPTQAEIARMVPRVDIREGCDGTNGQVTSHREWTDGNGQRHVRVRICNSAIEAQAHRAQLQGEAQARRAEAQARVAEREGEAQARRAEAQARVAEAQAERQAARAERDAERYDRMGKQAARRGLMNARVQIANSRMPAKDQAEALRDIDDEIASLDRGED